MRESEPTPFAPHVEDVERIVIMDFLDWLYEAGPSPDTVTREKLYILWRARHGIKAMVEGVPRYIPADGHDWQSESPGDAVSPRALTAPGDKPSAHR